MRNYLSCRLTISIAVNNFYYTNPIIFFIFTFYFYKKERQGTSKGEYGV
jgi:hypothetical protein